MGLIYMATNKKSQSFLLRKQWVKIYQAYHYENIPIQIYVENFTTKKKKKKMKKNPDKKIW